MTRTGHQMLLGEWACLGLLCEAPAHGFAVAARLKPEGDIGRVWELSRALTYRALAQLSSAGLVEDVATERGLAGGNRTVLRPTRRGRTAFMAWLAEPVPHLRDLRSELLLKLVLAEHLQVDMTGMLRRQRDLVSEAVDRLAKQLAALPDDMITRWRWENAKAALAFLEHLNR